MRSLLVGNKIRNYEHTCGTGRHSPSKQREAGTRLPWLRAAWYVPGVLASPWFCSETYVEAPQSTALDTVEVFILIIGQNGYSMFSMKVY